ncbi:Lrp/AsnC ligand binding domain-containing protein [Streptomyces sp. NPDC005349]|uniref:Lrp/AsnC ligand binding domain-containing protein n=1 Tax=Streptomyces sp. NPDC005349 TaxID=3157037 RepID=UPI0033AF68CE
MSTSTLPPIPSSERSAARTALVGDVRQFGRAADHAEETSQVLAGLREVRSCAITAGPHNLVVDVWLRTLHDVHAFEAHVSRRLPRLTVTATDRSVVLRTVKHMGRLLGRDGHSVGVVPLRHPCR